MRRPRDQASAKVSSRRRSPDTWITAVRAALRRADWRISDGTSMDIGIYCAVVMGAQVSGRVRVVGADPEVDRCR